MQYGMIGDFVDFEMILLPQVHNILHEIWCNEEDEAVP